MQRGQVSFDFILAIIVALIFIGGVQALGGQMEEMQSMAAVRNQEKIIALNVYRLVSTASALEDADRLDVSYGTGKLLVHGEKALQQCTIQLTTTPPQINYALDGAIVSVEIPTPNTSGLNLPDAVGCGETITISGS
jgi:hypothetical protein